MTYLPPGNSPYVIYVLATLVAARVFYTYLGRKSDNPDALPLPPGPKGLPIVGNVFDIPLNQPWLVYDDWIKTYGDMVYLNILGKGILILGSMERINDIFEKRGNNYSDRPPMPMIKDLMGWDFALSFSQYGAWHRLQRRTFHTYFGQSVIHRYQPTQISTTRALLRNLLRSPNEYRDSIKLFLADLIIRVTYGSGVDNWDNENVKDLEEALGMVFEAAVPGRYLVDIFPLMKYIPSWFPGAGWKRTAELSRKLVTKAVNDPYERVKKEMSEGKAVPSVCSQLIEALPSVLGSPERAKEEHLAKSILAQIYTAGADTTTSACLTFLLAMTLYPEIQRKAQAELDSVLQGRLPEFSDRPSLPYINAMVKETNRWQMVTPCGLYHSATESGIYDGYYIPRGTLVLGNGWTILHDPQEFESPDQYIPERYLKDGKINPEVRDPTVAAFGYGKRKCPGRFFSEDSLFSIIAHVLSVYELKPGLDSDGKEVRIIPEYTSRAASHPGPFGCMIRPRSKAAEDLIRSTESQN